MTQRIYRLTEVRPIRGVAGRPRVATDSNRIYTDIGYEPVCDSIDYAFEPA